MREAMLAQRASRDHGAGTVPTVHDEFVLLVPRNDVDVLGHRPERHVDGAGHVATRKLALGAHVENDRRRTSCDSRKQRAGSDASYHAVWAPAGTGTSAAATASAATSADNK